MLKLTKGSNSIPMVQWTVWSEVHAVWKAKMGSKGIDSRVKSVIGVVRPKETA
jgi:hypothetical protein